METSAQEGSVLPLASSENTLKEAKTPALCRRSGQPEHGCPVAKAGRKNQRPQCSRRNSIRLRAERCRQDVAEAAGRASL